MPAVARPAPGSSRKGDSRRASLVGGTLAITGGIGAQWSLDAQRRRAERRGLAGAFAGELAALLSAMQLYSKMFLEFMEDLAGKFEPHETAAALEHLRAARDLVDEGIKLSPACLEEARRQAR